MKRLLFLVLILVSCGLYAQSVGPFSPREIGGISSILSPIKFGGKKLPSWLTSEYSPITNGINSYASTTALADSSPNYTVMAWVKPYGAPASGRFISTRVSAASASIDIYQAATATLGVSVSNIVFTVQAAPQTQWIHAAVSKAGASATLYINSSPVETKAVPAGQSLFEGQLYFGRYTTQWGNCGLSEANFFNRALSASDIQRYYTKRLRGTETGLVALYHMNDNAQTLIDSVGGKNAVASNSVAWTKRNGYQAPDPRSERYALSFDGVDDSGIASQNFQLTGNYSMGGWFFLDSSTTAGAMVAVGSTTGAVGNEIGFSPVSGFVSIYTRGVNATATQKLDNAWHHLFLTASGTAGNIATISLYIDGVATSTAINSTNIAINISQPNGQIAFGRRVYSATYRKGKQADFTIWNRVLTQSEIQTLMYSMPAGNASGLIYYAKQNEGTGTTTNDSSSTQATMTLLLGPTWVGRDIP